MGVRRCGSIGWVCVAVLGAICSGAGPSAPARAQAPIKATPEPAAVAAAKREIHIDALKGDVYFLASEPLQGRSTGTRGDRITTAYIASRFMRLGLKPMGDGGTYFQNMPVLWGEVDRAHTALTATVDGVVHTYQYGRDFSWVRQSLRNQNACGGIVFAGYGIDAPEYGYNDFQNVDVKGKVALVLEGEPATEGPGSKFMGEWPTWHSFNRAKVEVLRHRGVAAILMISNPGKHRTLSTPASSPRSSGRPIMALEGAMWDVPVFSVTRAVADQFLAPSGRTIDQLESKMDAAVAPDSFTVPASAACLTKAYTNVTRHVGQNVVALLPGSDPKLRAETVLVTAHHDHMGKSDGHIYYGADDNASGVAAVLETAHAFVESGIRPRRSVLFMTFDGEERLWLGSWYYLQHPVVPLATTVADLNMDMIGRNEDDANWPVPANKNVNMVNVLGTRYNPALSHVIAAENRQVGLILDHKMDRVSPDVLWARSDQFWFATHGIPQVEFQTGLHPDYHTDNDTWDRINYPKLTRITRLVFLTTNDLARSDVKIPFVAADSSVEDSAAGGPWNVQPLWPPLRAATAPRPRGK